MNSTSSKHTLSRNDPCWCGSGLKWKKCHAPLISPSSCSPDSPSSLADQYLKKYKILLKTKEQIEGIRHACQITAAILNETAAFAKVGVTTNEINAFAEKLHHKANAIAAPLGYGSPPFPKSICTSINDQICHGIPDDRPLEEGDIVNIDVSCIVNGYFGDCSKMVTIGNIDAEKMNVVQTSYDCLMGAIAILEPGLKICEIGEKIEEIAAKRGCSVVNQFVGHGIGLDFHEPPEILHHRNKMNLLLVPGMTFTIEPMINAGVREGFIDAANHWTAYTNDGKPSAQWEHTVLITPNGYEILTQIS